jgi:hypothetical protein
MDDMEGQVRELLRRRADDVPPQLAVPPALAGRGQRRFAANAFGAAIVAMVLVAGVFGGVRAIGHAPVRQPGASGSVPPVSSAQCTTPDLQATAALEGAMGSREGEIVLTNVSDVACTLEGTPDLQLLAAAGEPVIRDIEVSATDPGWLVNGDPKPDGWPLVTVPPGEQAAVRVRWSNWCLDQPPATWAMSMGQQGAVFTVEGITADPPPCNGASQPSTIEIGPVEPVT